MASSIVSHDKIKYTDYLGSSQQGENCLLNQPVLYKPCQKSFVQKPPGPKELTEESKDFVRNQCGNHSINKMSKARTTRFRWW